MVESYQGVATPNLDVDSYKLTEVGPIPSEWRLSDLEGLTLPNGIIRGPFGGSLKKEFFKRSGFVVYEQRHAIYGATTAFRYFIDLQKFRELSRFRVSHGDYIVSCSGTIGAITKLLNPVPGVINQALLLLKVDAEKCIPEYFFHYFKSSFFQAAIIDNTQGGAMKNMVGMSIFKRTPIPIPTLTEQRAIARALSDTDALLAALEALIAKKEAIKRATLEELLSGARRLAGFDSSREKFNLGQIANITTGSKNNQDKVPSGQYPFFVRSQNVEKIDTYSYDTEAILVPGEGNIGSIFHYIDGKFEVHQRVYKIDNFADFVSGKFIYWYMVRFFGPHAMENSVKATVDSLRLPTFLNFEVLLPENVEQEAISFLLSDMDAELSALRARREKLARVKAGMMEELLTGRTRLV